MIRAAAKTAVHGGGGVTSLWPIFLAIKCSPTAGCRSLYLLSPGESSLPVSYLLRGL